MTAPAEILADAIGGVRMKLGAERLAAADGAELLARGLRAAAIEECGGALRRIPAAAEEDSTVAERALILRNLFRQAQAAEAQAQHRRRVAIDATRLRRDGGSNRERIRRFYREHPGCTRREASRALALNLETVAVHVRALRLEWSPMVSAKTEEAAA